MKRNSLAIIITLAFSLTGISASAHQRCQEDWKQKMQAEKIAFLTMETGMTPEEAQVFWPVYNQVNKDRDEAMKTAFNAYRELETAIEAGKSEKEIERLLEKYTDAQKAQRALDNKVAEQYKKVLPVEKVAKVLISEEKFRRQHIRRLHGKPGPKPEGQANR